MRTPSKKEIGDAVAICIMHCRATPAQFDGISNNRENLVEWRFQGGLGFGGKLYWNGRWFRVSCYPEHETPERKEMIAEANTRLKSIKKGWFR